MLEAPELSNPRAERVSAVRALSSSSVRKRRGEMLVEGPQAVREALRFAPDLAREFYFTPKAAERYPDIMGLAADSSRLRVWETTDQVSVALSTDAQGLVLVAQQAPAQLAELKGHLSDVDGPALVVVIAEGQDPGNVGTIIRTADALGAHAVVLGTGSVHPDNPILIRSSAGSIFHLPVGPSVDLSTATAALQEIGLQVLGADARGTHVLHEAIFGTGQLDLAAPTAWMFGNEARGFSPDQLELCDAVVQIDMPGHAESFNVATAAALCLHGSVLARR